MDQRATWTRVPQWFGVALIAALLVAAGVTDLPAAGFRVIDLGTLGGHSSEATALNASGQIVGSSTDENGAAHAFLYTDGAMVDLGTLPGGTSSHATGINDLGQVVGYGGINEYGPQFAEFTEGFVWDSGTIRSVGALHCPCTFNRRYGTSAGYAIGPGGQVLGDSGTVRGESIRHAFLWHDGVMQDIGDGAGSLSISFAYGINALGPAVGASDGRAALFAGTGHLDLGTLPGHATSTARAISDAGRVVGESTSADGSVSRAFLWDGAMRDLGTLPGHRASQARAINRLGQVVGWSGAPGNASRAFLW